MMRPLELAANVWSMITLLRRASPRAFVMMICANLLVGILPGALLYVSAQIVSSLTRDVAMAVVMGGVIAYVLINGFHDAFGAVSGFIVDAVQDAARMTIRRDVNHAVATFPGLGVHEEPEVREAAVLALDAGEQVADLTSHLYAVSVGVTMLAPILMITGGLAWWIPCFMLAGMVPMVWFRAKAERESWDVKANHGATFNELRILDRMLTQPAFAKDLRLFGLQARFFARWHALYGGYLGAVGTVRVRNALRLAVVSVFTNVCVAVPLYAVVQGVRAGRHDTAQLVFFMGALVQLNQGLGAIIYNLGDLLRASYAIRPLRALLAYRNTRECADVAYGAPPGACVDLRGVTVAYRGAGRAALDRVDLRLRRGEVLVVVGDNGAGKTSLLKVMSGLCQPTAGEVAWSDAVRRPPAVVGVFQDFARFPATVAANLASDDVVRMRACLEAVGLGFLTDHLDVPLTTELEGGIDLSGGEWQRLAIARAMLHADDADLLLFDEPTAALDPESEGEIMRLILSVAKGHTAMIVSHRLALTRFADRIVVLDAGRIVESGTHDALIRRHGKYARMFESQAMFYRSSESPDLDTEAPR